MGYSKSMVVVVGLINFKGSPRFGKGFLIRILWQLNLLDDVQVPCRITHVKSKVVHLSITQIKTSRVDWVLALF